MSTANPNKLKVKDIITVVLLALINVVIWAMCRWSCSATPTSILNRPSTAGCGSILAAAESEGSIRRSASQ